MLRSFTLLRTRIVRPWLPRDVYALAKALLLAIVAVQLVRLFWVIVEPVGPLGDWRPAVARTLPVAARGALIGSYDAFGGAAEQVADAPVDTAGLTLFGTRESFGTIPAGAIIAGSDGVQNSYVVGEEVLPGITLAAVAFDHVELARGGARTTLYLDPPGSDGTAPAPTVAPADPAAAAGAAAGGPVTAEAVRQAVGFAPRLVGDRVTGVTLTPNGDGALFRAAGFRPGDVLVAVNGRAIASQGDLAALQSQLQPGARLSLTVERGGNRLPIALNLSGN